MNEVVIIGAGAAGCFTAQRLKELRPELHVTVLEANSHPLAKVAITGGGRCNLTNSFRMVKDLKWVYPRGHKIMKHLLKEWNHNDIIGWFLDHGVPTIIQEDECVFPESQDALDIVNALKRGLDIRCNSRIKNIDDIKSQNIVITTGGSRNFDWLKSLNLELNTPLPSLFPFKLSKTTLTECAGMVVTNATASLAGTKFKAEGPLLITHIGVSGPAILKLSSYAAQYLKEVNYQAKLLINWLGEKKENEVREWIEDVAKAYPQRLITNIHPEEITSKHWNNLLDKIGIKEGKRWSELSLKETNRLTNILLCDEYDIIGRAPNKEEFVTCGGVALSNIDKRTMECKTHPGIYFAGEVLDIDGITGGFNLQAAWTTANAVAKAISEKV